MKGMVKKQEENAKKVLEELSKHKHMHINRGGVNYKSYKRHQPTGLFKLGLILGLIIAVTCIIITIIKYIIFTFHFKN